MPPEPLSDQERVQLFVAPCGVMLEERADVLARIYSGVMATGNEYQDSTFEIADQAVIRFLKLIDGQP